MRGNPENAVKTAKDGTCSNVTNVPMNTDTYHHRAEQVHALVVDLAISAADGSAACCSGNKLAASSAHKIHWLRQLVLAGTSDPSVDPVFHRQCIADIDSVLCALEDCAIL